ncbi:kunitz-type U19-barytoxin-Tl1a-like [Ornithodoros turicata]|uniref:kunitz-type U19-barytoxin-Tl1a-like n=1 Tax=Ornithodoros turicata TaxID=34597 RepID=UPI003139F3D7
MIKPVPGDKILNFIDIVSDLPQVVDITSLQVGSTDVGETSVFSCVKGFDFLLSQTYEYVERIWRFIHVKKAQFSSPRLHTKRDLRVLATSSKTEKRCRLDADRGPCKAYNPRWFHNFTSGECEEYIYGGCRGNANRFANKKACTDACKRVLPKACTLPSTEGVCRAGYDRWYFNETLSECKKFDYGGCGGNSNGFNTKKECRDFCIRKKQPAGGSGKKPDNERRPKPKNPKNGGSARGKSKQSA